MKKHHIYFSLVMLFAATSVMATDKAKLIDELSSYLEFVDYGGVLRHQIFRS